MVSKAYYEDKLESALTHTKDEISRLKSTGDPAHTAMISELTERVDTIGEKLKQIETADNSLWEKLKTEMEDILAHMGAGFANVAADNETDAVIGTSTIQEEKNDQTE